MEIPVNLTLSALDSDTFQTKSGNSGKRISHLKDHDERSEIKKVAKEMESLFIFELLKAMRKTSESISPDKNGLGNDTYMSLFDMEVSRVMADRGFGLQNAIENWLERRSQISNNITDREDEK